MKWQMVVPAVAVVALASVLAVYGFAISRPTGESDESGSPEVAPSDGGTPAYRDPSHYYPDGSPRIEFPHGWQYSSEKDAIRGGYTEFATIVSDTHVSLSDGTETALYLQFAKVPGEGISAILYLDLGKFGCDSLCVLPASVDGKRQSLLFIARPQFGTLTSVNGEDLVRQLKRAKTIIIEVPLVDLGSEQFAFSVEGLGWTLRPNSLTQSAPPQASAASQYPAQTSTPRSLPNVPDDEASEPPHKSQGSSSSGAHRPTPVGKISDWIRTDEYPPGALRERRQGTTLFRLTIDIDGAIKDCRVISTSGSAELDKATCERVRQRGRFNPAVDTNGQPAEATAFYQAVWAIR